MINSERLQISATVRAAIWHAHNQRCAYTGEPLAFVDLEIDHIIPVGITAAEFDGLIAESIISPNFDLNGLENFLPTSRFHNNRKRAKLLGSVDKGDSQAA